MFDNIDDPAQAEGEQAGGLNITTTFPLPGYISYETRKTGLFG
jgi:hypothetical protein